MAVLIFTLKGCWGIAFTHGVRMGGWLGGRQEKVCPAYISETVSCRKLILGRTLVRGCRCAASWCDLAVVTLSFKIMSGPYFRNHKV